jgi:hypothetical protein
MGVQYNLQQPHKAGWTNLIVETEQAIRLLDTRMQDAYHILAAKKHLHNTHNNTTQLHYYTRDKHTLQRTSTTKSIKTTR